MWFDAFVRPLAGNEGGGARGHLPGWAIALIILACAAALYFGGKRSGD